MFDLPSAEERCRVSLKRVSAGSAATRWPWLGRPLQSQVRPRFSGPLERSGGAAGHRSGSARVQTRGLVCPPVSLDHLSLRLSPVALRGGDNMLDCRPREPEFPRDGRRLEARLLGGQDQPLLSRCQGTGPVGRSTLRLRPFRLPVFVHGILRHVVPTPSGLLDRRLHQPVQCVVVEEAERPSEIGRQGEASLRRGAVVARGG